MFAIILNLKIDAAIFAQRRQYRRDKAVAPAAYRSFFAIQRDLADEEAIAASVGGLAFLIIDQREGLVRRQAIMEDRKSVVSGKSVSVRVDLGGRRIIKKKQKSNE